jgi:hypothetical protein
MLKAPQTQARDLSSTDRSKDRSTRRSAEAQPWASEGALRMLRGARLTAASAADLHRMIGNRAVVRLLSAGLGKSEAGQVRHIQRERAGNPHYQSAAIGGWPITAHHIVSHESLKWGREKIKDPAKKRALLQNSIPAVITEPMFRNLLGEKGMASLPERTNLVTEAENLRKVLAGIDPEPEDGLKYGMKISEMQDAFFEWQGGNVFLGPNTSIRPEPGKLKSDTDTDARFFTNYSPEEFGQLTGYAEQLKGYQKAEGTDQEPSEDVILKTLNDMLALTKDRTPDPVDESKWVEIKSMAEIEDLGEKIGRSDWIKKYSFYRVNISDTAAPTSVGGGGAAGKYKAITYNNGDWTYDTVKFAPQVKSTFFYIPLEGTNTVKVTPGPEKSVIELLTNLGIEITHEGDPVKGNTKFARNDRTRVDGKMFVLKDPSKDGYLEDFKIPFDSNASTAETLVAKTAVLTNKKRRDGETRGKPLQDYCAEQNMPTSTYLPKKLYDEVTRVPEPEPDPEPTEPESPVSIPPVLSAKSDAESGQGVAGGMGPSPQQAPIAPKVGGGVAASQRVLPPGMRIVGGRRYGPPRRSFKAKQRLAEKLAKQNQNQPK